MLPQPLVSKEEIVTLQGVYIELGHSVIAFAHRSSGGKGGGRDVQYMWKNRLFCWIIHLARERFKPMFVCGDDSELGYILFYSQFRGFTQSQ